MLTVSCTASTPQVPPDDDLRVDETDREVPRPLDAGPVYLRPFGQDACASVAPAAIALARVG